MTKKSSNGWRENPTHAEAVSKVKAMMQPVYRPYVDTTPCFSLLWIDDGIECDQLQCGLRAFCKQSWQLAQVSMAEAAKAPTKDTAYAEAYSKDLAAKETDRPFKNVARNRGKYKGLSKYSRKGYVPADRPSDRLIKIFREEFLKDYTEVLDKWASSKSIRGTIAWKATASYHSVIHDGTLILRLWTNAYTLTTMDMVPELVAPLVLLAKNTTSESMLPVVIPEASREKTHPCTHRITIKTEQEMRRVIQTLQQFEPFYSVTTP